MISPFVSSCYSSYCKNMFSSFYQLNNILSWNLIIYVNGKIVRLKHQHLYISVTSIILNFIPYKRLFQVVFICQCFKFFALFSLIMSLLTVGPLWETKLRSEKEKVSEKKELSKGVEEKVGDEIVKWIRVPSTSFWQYTWI